MQAQVTRMPRSFQTSAVLPSITCRLIAIRDSHKISVTNMPIKVYAELVNRDYGGTSERVASQPIPRETRHLWPECAGRRGPSRIARRCRGLSAWESVPYAPLWVLTCGAGCPLVTVATPRVTGVKGTARGLDLILRINRLRGQSAPGSC
jgi:hypothetical protein